ncbi:MAG: TIGR02452 family protein, partial [Myxococcota bacterium]
MSLKSIAKETLAILDAGTYTAPSGALRNIAQSQTSAEAQTVLYRPDALRSLLKQASTPQEASPLIEVWESTTQEAALRLTDTGAQVALLNFASARNPGGGFLNGARAQEEDLARCSGLYRCLLRQPRYYQINRAQSSMLYTDHIIYSPDVPFFRVHSRQGLLEHPFYASVITAPAPNAGQFRRKRRGRGQPLSEALHRRAGYVLAVARDHGHRVLVLGAWGCGVFRNDPAAVADAFGAWLEHPTFQGDFDRVVFAIYDPTRGQLNLWPFVACSSNEHAAALVD